MHDFFAITPSWVFQKFFTFFTLLFFLKEQANSYGRMLFCLFPCEVIWAFKSFREPKVVLVFGGGGSFAAPARSLDRCPPPKIKIEISNGQIAKGGEMHTRTQNADFSKIKGCKKNAFYKKNYKATKKTVKNQKVILIKNS